MGSIPAQATRDVASVTILRKSARGRECQVRIPGVCNGDPETTVLAHLPGGGMGKKRNDLFAAFACSDCHDYVDCRKPHPSNLLTNDERLLYFYEGVHRTQQIWLDEGLITIQGERDG